MRSEWYHSSNWLIVYATFLHTCILITITYVAWMYFTSLEFFEKIWPIRAYLKTSYAIKILRSGLHTLLQSNQSINPHFKKWCHLTRVSIRGVESLWVDCRFIPADQGSHWVICAICSYWILFTKIMIKSVKVFPFSFRKIHFFYFIKIKPWHKHAKWPPSDFTSWTPTLMFLFAF